MVYCSDRYVHPADKAALRALKSIPGFSALMKGFMSIWNEPQDTIINMSTRIKLGENQMAKYYNMLPPICDKLNIDIPDMYLELDVYPNSYTWGDTHPYIVITSGLIETIPDELIPTIIAHECGHVACHHALYTTMGATLLNGASSTLNLFKFGGLLSTPLQIAFYYWMRCSEFSADRAAVLCDGTPEKMQEVCMRFAGFDKDIHAEANMAAFLQQAKDYKKIIHNSAWNKALEFMVLSQRSHPFTAVRALECIEWADSDLFFRIFHELPDELPESGVGKPSLPDELPESDVEKPSDEIQEPEAVPVDQAEVNSAPPNKPAPFDLFAFLKPKKQNSKTSQAEEKENSKTEDDANTIQEQTQETTTFDELREYKQLLDEGIITEDEFNIKKKELLGL